MASSRYRRIDTVVTIRTPPRSIIEASSALDSGPAVIEISRTPPRLTVEAEGAPEPGPELVEISSSELPHGRRILTRYRPDSYQLDAATIASLWPLWSPLSTPADDFEMRRLVLRVDEAWAGVDWEGAFAERWSVEGRRQSIVRISPVQPRARQAELAFPLHVLEIGTPRVVGLAVDQTLHGSKDTAALRVGSASLAYADSYVQRARWRAADVLHLHDRADADDLLSASRGEEPGTLGWILRMATRWQSRLVVVEGAAPSLPLLRQLGQAIVDRAGPAVLVADRRRLDRVGLYAALLHDRPLDWIQKSVAGVAALFAGSGREESLRTSLIAERLASPKSAAAIVAAAATARAVAREKERRRPTPAQLRAAIRAAARQLRFEATAKEITLGWEYETRRIRFGDTIADRLLTKGFVVRSLDDEMKALGGEQKVRLDRIVDLVAKKTISLGDVLDPSISPRFEDLIREKVDNVSDAVRDFHFEDAESAGTLPVAVKTVNLRNLVRAGRAELAEEPATPRPPRHVNSGFFRLSDEGELQAVPQAGARLRLGEELHLGIRIGPRDELTVSFGDTVLAESVFPWDSGVRGCWIEVGVTSLDFDLVGAPVQEAWLPREGEMPLVAFALSPRSPTAVPGVARVRFTLYYRDNVVQSFVLAALLEGFAGEAAAGLAAALGLPRDAMPVDDVGFLARLEYSAVDPESAASVPPRGLSIVGNDIAGQKVFTLKGQDFFSSTVNADVGPLVDDARAALRRASYDEAKGEYRFGAQNFGDWAALPGLLWDLASAGWKLFQQILPGDDARAAVRRQLETETVIHAAHISLGQSVPWALVYDLPIDESRTAVYEPGTPQAVPVRPREVCAAGMYEGHLGAEQCEKNEGCPLYGADAQGRVRHSDGSYSLRETVVCPRHFWGFAHQIEVPAQQAQPGKETPPIQDRIPATASVKVAIGHNPNVKLAGEHVENLMDALKAKASFDVPPVLVRDAIVDLLKSVQPDVVYLYCHAWVDTLAAPGKYAPNLDFGKRAIGDIVAAADLAGAEWTRRPLVFLNGCGTVGFSPAAPSPFVTSLVQGRKASAVIGTEVTVWPELATEMALWFLDEFLDGGPKTAGQALLDARRRFLLEKNNPLGLVYTLYGSADLAIARS